MRYRLRTLMIVLGIGPPAMAVAWALRDDSVSHRVPELALILGALLSFLLSLYPLTLAAAWTVDSTAALLGHLHKRR